MNTWPTPEEIENQQNPFDPNGSYPFEYKIVVLEKIEDDVFQEQLRTYRITECLDEQNMNVPDASSVIEGRKFRVAREDETADIHVMNSETTSPIGLKIVN